MKRDFRFMDKNIKTKLFSVVIAVILWLYVVEIVDPSEKKTIVDIPITITNVSELSESGYEIYPKENLHTDITIEGNLSEVQKLNKNNIHIFGTVANPVEGKNIVNLSTNISSRVSRELKDNTFVINLEKIVTKKVPIKFEIPSSEKNDVSSIESTQDSMIISGPRSVIKDVEYLSGTIDFQNRESKTSKVERVKLTAYNGSDMEMSVPLEKKYVNVEIKYNISRSLPVKIDYKGEDYNINSYKVSPEKVVVRGSEEKLSNMDYIYTREITDEDMKNIGTKKFSLNTSNGVVIDGEDMVTISEDK